MLMQSTITWKNAWSIAWRTALILIGIDVLLWIIGALLSALGVGSTAAA